MPLNPCIHTVLGVLFGGSSVSQRIIDIFTGQLKFIIIKTSLD